MSYTLESVNTCTKKLAFNCQSIDLSGQIDIALKNKQKGSNLKGFRKGKAPLAMIRQMFGPQIENEALYKFIQDQFVAAITEEKIKTVGYPKFDNTNYDSENKSVQFDVTVEIFPQVQLKEYTSLSFSKDKVEIDPEEAAKIKANYLGSKAEMIAIEDESVELKTGHFAVINFQGEKEDGERPDNMKGQEYLLEVGSNTFIPGFEEKIIGMKSSENKKVDLTFPDDYHVDELKNAKVKFDVELLEIKEKKLPELTDELAKEIGYENIEDFNTKVEKNLVYQKERGAKEKLHQEILDKLIEENSFEVPEAMVQQQEEHLRQDMINTLKNQGFSDSMVKDYFDKWQSELNTKAVFQVRSGLILNQLADDFKIETSDEDLKAKFAEIAEQSGMDSAQVEQQYTSNENLKNNLSYAIREEKTFEKFLEKVKVV